MKDFLRQYISPRSLRARVFFIILIIGIVPSVTMRYGILRNYEMREVELRMQSMQSQLKIVADHLVNEDYFNNPSSAVVEAEMETISSLYDGRVLIINGNFKVLEDTYRISEGKTMVSEEVIKCFLGEASSYYDAENGYIKMAIPIMDYREGAENSKIVGVMLMTISTDSIMTTMEKLNQKAFVLELLMIMVIVALALVSSVILAKPFDRVTKAISEVQAGHSTSAIAVSDLAETQHIIEAFNHLLGQMNMLDRSRQEFVANVSHELKTPLASMKVLADSLLMQGEVPAELYREFLEDIVSEIDRENEIITNLLALVRMDKSAMELNISTIRINDLVELILKRLRPIARKKDVEVVFESVREVSAEVDEVKITLVLTNLVENAIKYNKDHGWVKVTLDADHQYFTVQVSDSGIGIPEESLAQIYERFYRVEKSHSKEISGTGLGLAITKNAILLHKGSITVSSTEGEGTTFLVKIPLSYIS